MNGRVTFGEAREIQLEQGVIRHREVGTGELLLLVKGFDQW